VIVTLDGWADYVFADDYALRPLPEVESFVRQHRHLPDIPAAAHVADHGVPVGEMQKRLLQKVEELTLYLIEMRKENALMKAELERLRSRIDRDTAEQGQ
jgi:hypothetical protein